MIKQKASVNATGPVGVASAVWVEEVVATGAEVVVTGADTATGDCASVVSVCCTCWACLNKA